MKPQAHSVTLGHKIYLRTPKLNRKACSSFLDKHTIQEAFAAVLAQVQLQNDQNQLVKFNRSASLVRVSIKSINETSSSC